MQRRGASWASIGDWHQHLLEWPLMQVIITIILHSLIVLHDHWAEQHYMSFTYVTSVLLGCVSLTLCLPLLSFRFLILHLWHSEEPWLETFPRAAGTPLLKQPWCPHSENPCKPALWGGCWCHRSVNIVSAEGRQPTSLELTVTGVCYTVIYWWFCHIVFIITRYPLDVARRRMQLGAVLPDSEKCV